VPSKSRADTTSIRTRCRFLSASAAKPVLHDSRIRLCNNL
jgi:hypothetical protein